MQPDRTDELAALLDERILILDGAMGTMIQSYRLDEADYRGACLAGHDHDLKGDNDLLVLTQPDVVRAIHDAYLEAGADIVETNTFNATSIAQADYGLEGRVREINAAAARLARECADAWTATHAGQAALRRRRARPDQPHGVDLARRQRSRRAQRPLRRARRRRTPRRSKASPRAAPISSWSRRSSTR